ncbi:unnamed protein product [Paramecium octaurelia]|uniref:Uncharacterized protein n=1 Tax=Paramecium octaurelia TaxID=43137 RepID=A0A8S1S3W2_PAROT|nr:unnamed protein product [Paramecium octaurelia]
MKMMKQEIMNNNQLNSNSFKNKEKELHIKNKKKMKNRHNQFVKIRRRISLQIQKSEATKQNLQHQNWSHLNHQKLLIEEKKHETLKIENDIINNAINWQSIEGELRNRKEKCNIIQLIVEQQMKELQQQKKEKDQEFKQLICKGYLEIQLQIISSSKNFLLYQGLPGRQNALQDIY